MYTPDFSAYAGRIHIVLRRPRGGAEISRSIEKLMSGIAVRCGEAGATLIGHIKSIAETEGGGYLACSATDSSGLVKCRGSLKDGTGDFSLVVNVLLYGLERERIEEIVEDEADGVFGGPDSEVKLEDLEVEHDHDHEHGHDHEHEHGHEDDHDRDCEEDDHEGAHES